MVITQALLNRHPHKPSNGPNISHVTPIGEALLRSTLEKTRYPVAFWSSSGAAFRHIERLLSEKPCGAGGHADQSGSYREDNAWWL